MKAKQLREKNNKELQELLKELREKLIRVRFDMASGKVKNIKEIRFIKKDIARILTILKERELEKIKK